jgi:hypothetical protein
MATFPVYNGALGPLDFKNDETCSRREWPFAARACIAEDQISESLAQRTDYRYKPILNIDIFIQCMCAYLIIYSMFLCISIMSIHIVCTYLFI